jgi:hypothetical protein
MMARTWACRGSIWVTVTATLWLGGGGERGKARAQDHAGDKFCLDANGDGKADLSDAVFTLNYLFLGSVTLDCTKAAHEAPHLREEIARLRLEVERLTAELAATRAALARRGLPATGQAACWDTAGVLDRDCTATEGTHPRQDGAVKAGCPLEGRFVDNGDGTVTDTCTGLMWEKEPAFPGGTWRQALRYASNLGLATHTDWRMPNVQELHSVVNYGRPTTVDPAFFAGIRNEWWWTSTTPPDRLDTACVVHDMEFLQEFNNPSCVQSYGPVSVTLKHAALPARAVRGPLPAPSLSPLPATGQTECFHTSGVEIGCADPFHPGQDGTFQVGCPREDRFVDLGDGTVADKCTGLLWQKQPHDRNRDGTFDYLGDGATWQEALEFCSGLGGGWRLPNVLELQTLLDYSNKAALDPGVFPTPYTPGRPAEHWEWTSTSNPAAPSEAFTVLFGRFTSYGDPAVGALTDHGRQVVTYPKDAPPEILVRPVRSLR